MTRISFLHGSPDRIQSAAQWLQQAWAARATTPVSVLVYAPLPEQAARLDRLLWTQPQLAFVPHCRHDDALAAETPIRLADSLDNALPDDCLLNLSNELPPGFSRFEHLVEIVSTEDADRLPARERFKFYRDRGYAIDSRDISGDVQ